MELKRVAVTGLGALTPLGKTVEEYWSALKSGVSGAQPITRFDATNFKTQFACEVKDFDPQDYFERKEARKIDRFAQFGIVAADQAIAHAGLGEESKLDKDRVGVIWGSGIGGIEVFESEVSKYHVESPGTPRFNPFFIPKMIIDICPGHISIKHGFRGPNFSTVSACASASHAISDAFNYIRLGKAEVIVTGGSEAAITEAGMGGFNAMKALSARNESPETASRPYDKSRDGFVLGEGAGAIILEEYEHAKARGATIYAELVGMGATADAYHLTAPHPEGAGVIRLLEETLSDAQMQPTDIDYINTHGTSTPLGDIAELNAIKKVFGEHIFQMNISSTKSMTGHLLGGAGAVEALATILALQHQTVPPTINHFEDDPDIDERINLTFNKPQKRSMKAAISNTFGFGGHNSSLIFKIPN